MGNTQRERAAEGAEDNEDRDYRLKHNEKVSSRKKRSEEEDEDEEEEHSDSFGVPTIEMSTKKRKDIFIALCGLC